MNKIIPYVTITFLITFCISYVIILVKREWSLTCNGSPQGWLRVYTCMPALLRAYGYSCPKAFVRVTVCYISPSLHGCAPGCVRVDADLSSMRVKWRVVYCDETRPEPRRFCCRLKDLGQGREGECLPSCRSRTSVSFMLTPLHRGSAQRDINCSVSKATRSFTHEAAAGNAAKLATNWKPGSPDGICGSAPGPASFLFFSVALGKFSWLLPSCSRGNSGWTWLMLVYTLEYPGPCTPHVSPRIHLFLKLQI